MNSENIFPIIVTVLAMIAVFIFVTSVLSILLFFLSFGMFGFFNSCKRKKRDSIERNDYCGGKTIPDDARVTLAECRAWIDESTGEDIYIRSYDRLKLHGKLIQHNDKAKGLVIFFHGYHSSCRRDLAIQSKGIFDDGYDILLVSQRGHGKSGGQFLTFGIKERRDALSWSKYAAHRFPDTPIALMGLSMGGATVAMASELALPDSVKCIIDDCGFTSPFAITKNTIANTAHIPPYPTIWFMEMCCILIGGFSLYRISVPRALEKNTRPLLIIHGELDRYVPTEMSLKNASIKPDITELVIVPSAKHAQSVYYDRDGYIRAVTDFLGKHL